MHHEAARRLPVSRLHKRLGVRLAAPPGQPAVLPWNGCRACCPGVRLEGTPRGLEVTASCVPLEAALGCAMLPGVELDAPGCAVLHPSRWLRAPAGLQMGQRCRAGRPGVRRVAPVEAAPDTRRIADGCRGAEPGAPGCAVLHPSRRLRAPGKFGKFGFVGKFGMNHWHGYRLV